MLDKIFKNSAIVYLLNTILFAVIGYKWLAHMIFPFIMIVSTIYLMSSARLINKLVLNKAFYFYFLMNMINLLYFLFFEMGEIDALMYLAARFMGLTIFAYAIAYHYEYYAVKLFKHLGQILFFLAILSLLLHPPSLQRYSGLIGNSNEFGVLMALGFGMTYLTQKKRAWQQWIILVFFVLMTVMSGSRSALVGIVIPILIEERFNIRSIFSLSFFLILTIFVSDSLGYETGLTRIMEEDLLHNRILEYQYAYETYQDKWLLGNGLSRYAYINEGLIQVEHESLNIGAHNGYLAVLVQYGVLFGTAFFLTLLFAFFKCKQYVFEQWNKTSVKLSVFIISYALFSSFFETVMTGINNFQTALFWFALGLLYYEAYHYKEEVS